ncbi:MAG TPA: hypothetical protein P5105_05250, partial [Victivallales bacterium]|nr:hypothetical protein [Victivallales bacterium]
TQVAGRAGRGDRPGEVIIQTFNPSNPAILFALKHDFKSFFNYEIDVRKKFFYPPITHMLALYFKSKNEDDIIKIADQLIVDLKPFLNKEIHITGPTPAPIPKIKGNFRYIILFKGNKLGLIKKQLKYLIYSKYKNKNVLIYADSDPVSLAK